MISQGEGFILQSRKYSRQNAGKSLSKYLLLKKNEFAYNHGASKAKPFGVTYRLVESSEARVPYVYHAFSITQGDLGFWSYALNTESIERQLQKMITSGVRMDGLLNISFEAYMSVSIPFPCVAEQHKIASLLSSVDETLDLCQRKLGLLTQAKKALMQQIFSQKLRFKADDGSEFPAWEEETVGDLFVFVSSKNTGNTIDNVITNSAEFGLIPQRDFFDKDIAVEGRTENYTIIHKGDFVYNPRKSTTAPYGPFNMYSREEVGIVSPLYTCLTPINSDSSDYLAWYFQTDRWFSYIVKNGAQGGARHDRVGMTNELMKKIPVQVPSLPEQKKIASCLSSADALIAQARAELKQWREVKKSLLQQMFV